MWMKRAPLSAAAFSLCTAAAVPAPAGAEEPARTVEMTADTWQANGELRFSKDATHPRGVMSVRAGGALLKNTVFGDGTIEYDIQEFDDNKGIPGIWFRQQGTESAENFYLRTDSDCPRSIECVQYAPVSHRAVQWEVYPEYQTGAPVKASGWNHVKLVISGKRMNVFVNREAAPSLVVASLEGDAPSGAIQLRGDARFTNVSVVPDAVEGLSPEALPDPTAADARFLRRWQLSPVSTLARGQEASFVAMPAASSAWEPITAERKGFVNLGRQHGTPKGMPDLVWLKTTLQSDRAQVKRVSIGWAHEIWVHVDGKLVFADRNVYYPESGRKLPLGRLSLENGAFDLPLEKGPNEVEIAISNDLGSMGHYGWGFQFRFDDIDGLALPALGPGM